MDLRANTSVSTDSGAEAYAIVATFGANFDNDRGNVVLSVDYLRQNNLSLNERENAEFSTRIVANNPVFSEALGIDPSFQNILVPNLRVNVQSAEGIIALNGNLFLSSLQLPFTDTFGGFPLLQTIDRETGQVRPFDPAITNGIFSIGGDGIDFISGVETFDLVPESNIVTINTNAHYDFAPGLTGFIEVKYTRNESSRVQSTNNNFANLVINPDNAFLPEVIRDQFFDIQAQGLNPVISLSKIPSSPGATAPQENLPETFRIVGGIEGSVSNAFNYEVSANYGRTDTVLTDNTEPLVDRFLAASDAVLDPVSGEIVCRVDLDLNAPLPMNQLPSVGRPGINSFTPGSGSCVPANFFGFASLSDEAAAFIAPGTETEFDLQQLVLNATFTGSSEDFYTLPAGPISYAFGAEYRE